MCLRIYHLHIPATSSNRVHSVHLPTCSSPTPSTVLLYHTCYVDRPSAAVILVSSSQYSSLADVLLSTKSDRTTVLPLCTPSSQLHTSRERPQPRTLVQPSNRLGCDEVPYTYDFLSLEQANIISETVDPYHTKVQTSARYLGNIYLRLPFPRTGKYYI